MIVLDAAALVDVVIDQRAKDWVLDQLSGQEICAPAHQPAEVLSALSRLRRSGILDRDGELMALDEATSLDEELVLPTALHLRQSAQMSDSDSRGRRALRRPRAGPGRGTRHDRSTTRRIRCTMRGQDSA